MKTKITLLGSLLLIFTWTLTSCGAKKSVEKTTEIISFYEVPLVCGAAPDIGCGSRLKPLFIDTKKEGLIKESWSNREGTVIAIVWNETATKMEDREKLIQPIFQKNGVEAKVILEDAAINELMTSFRADGKWYKEMDVDKLSLEEAGIIADDLTKFAKDSGLITEQERVLIKGEIEEYFKRELVIVRTEAELHAEETQTRWRDDGFAIYVKHIGQKRADEVSIAFEKYQAQKESCKKDNSCCEKEETKEDCCKKK